MPHIIHLTLGELLTWLGVKGHTRCGDAYEHNQRFGVNERLDIGKRQRLRKRGNARIYKVSALRPGLAMIIEKICISRYFKHPETDLHTADNTCCTDYADTWLWKRVHSLSNSQSMNLSTTQYVGENRVEFSTAVA